MSDTKFTPGPWVLKQEPGYQQIIANGESIMGSMHYYPWTPGNDADWNLIESAPDLYASLYDIIVNDNIDRDKAKAALAKARGEA